MGRTIGLPEELINDFVKFLELETSLILKILDEFKNSVHEKQNDQISTELSTKYEINVDIIEDFFRGCKFLFMIKSDIQFSRSEIVKSIQTNIKNSGSDKEKEEQIKIITEKVEQIFSIIFDNESFFGLQAKIERLRRDNPNELFSTQIYTDVRHLFEETIENNPRFGIIKHKIKIVTKGSEKMNTQYISANYGDLIKMKDKIERAIEKEELLIKYSEENNCKIILEEEEE